MQAFKTIKTMSMFVNVKASEIYCYLRKKSMSRQCDYHGTLLLYGVYTKAMHF